MAGWFPLPKEIETPHKGHGRHLCVAHVMNFIRTNPEDYKKLVRDSAYMCKSCGRTAAKAENLCEPEAL